MLSFEPRVDKVKTGLTLGGFTVIIPKDKQRIRRRVRKVKEKGQKQYFGLNEQSNLQHEKSDQHLEEILLK